eukprot:11256883-Alexandrium_andersonii.AAC.1
MIATASAGSSVFTQSSRRGVPMSALGGARNTADPGLCWSRLPAGVREHVAARRACLCARRARVSNH